MTAPFSGSRAATVWLGSADLVPVVGPTTTGDDAPAVPDTGTPSEPTAFPSEMMVARLDRYMAQVEGALAPNTVRAFRADMRMFTAWAQANEGTLPATVDQVVRFIEAMAADRAPATIRHYVSSIATFHRAAGAPDPCSSPDVGLAMKRMHRRRGRAQKQAAPLGRKHINRILAATPANTLIGLRDRALLATAYDTLARRSELAALDLDDLQLEGDGTGTLLIKRSKADQEGEGSLRFVAADTVEHLRAWIRASSIEQHPLFLRNELGAVVLDRCGAPLLHRPLFRSVRNKAVGVAIDPKDVARRFKAMAENAGLPAAMVRTISGHSTRVGAAQDMTQAGVALPAILQAGGWRSPEMVGRYTRRLEARRGGAAQLAELQKRGSGAAGSARARGRKP